MEEEKKDKTAVAIRFDTDKDDAPKVVAKGKGYIADKIEEVARDAGIPVREDAELVEYLNALNLYEEIPPFLYEVVAEILAFIYRMDRKKGVI
ncbi:MAG: EscU/YscU/HrcU family type III secretion system export apparatus switch protein [Acidobacteriota bacterium]